MLKIDGVIDKRTVVDIDNGYIRAVAVVINDDKTYSYITYMDDDDMRTWNNEAEIDATPEEIEAYRKYKNDFRFGDKIKIISGRKMKDEIKKLIWDTIKETVQNEVIKCLLDENRLKHLIEKELIRQLKIQDSDRKLYLRSTLDAIYNKIDETIHKEVTKRLIIELRDENEID